MSARLPPSWQVILADLALILFLTTLAGFVAAREREPMLAGAPFVAHSQALFRETRGAGEFGEWLELQGLDPRAQVTIFVRYTPQDYSQLMVRAGALRRQAAAAGQLARMIIEPGESGEIYAAIAYDALSRSTAD